jgi:hypothetical protein
MFCDVHMPKRALLDSDYLQRLQDFYAQHRVFPLYAAIGRNVNHQPERPPGNTDLIPVRGVKHVNPILNAGRVVFVIGSRRIRDPFER